MNFTSSGRSASNHASPIFGTGAGNHGKRSRVPHTFSLKETGRRRGALAFADEMLDPVKPALQFSHRSCVGNAYVLICSERLSWNNVDVRLRQKTIPELHRRLAS